MTSYYRTQKWTSVTPLEQWQVQYARHYSEHEGSINYFTSSTSYDSYGVQWDTSGGHLAHMRGVRSEFLGLSVTLGRNWYKRNFSRDLSRWHARINHGQIYIDLIFMMMQWFFLFISLPRRQYLSRRNRVCWRGSIITLYYLIFYTQAWLCFAILLSDLLLTQQFFTEGQTENVMTYHVSTMLWENKYVVWEREREV